MNTLHFVYAIEVEKAGSITQAADNLFMSQPTLSKAVKDLEETLGFAVFRRTPRGVVPTRKGSEFLNHAKKIVRQIEKMELALRTGDATHQLFSVAIPRAEYAMRAVSEFIRALDISGGAEFDIREASSIRAIDAVADSHFVLGLIRYHVEDEDYFLKSLTEKGLQFQTVWESPYVALVGRDHPLAARENLSPEDFLPYLEISFGDGEVPYIRVSEAESLAGAAGGSKRILVYARASQLDLLRANRLAYTWSCPAPQDFLSENGLVQLPCQGSGQFRDILISRSGYRFSGLDSAFLRQLHAQRDLASLPVCHFGNPV